MKIENVLIALLWLALAALTLLIGYAVADLLVRLTQQAIVIVWPVVAERPSVGAVAILALIVALGVIERTERR